MKRDEIINALTKRLAYHMVNGSLMLTLNDTELIESVQKLIDQNIQYESKEMMEGWNEI